MNPTPQEITLIATQLPNLTVTETAGRVEELNALVIDNPVPQPMLKRVLVKAEVAQLLSIESQSRLLNFNNLRLVYESFDAQDHESAVSWVYSLVVAGIITEAERDICYAHIVAVVPDPSWQPQVSWAQLHLHREVDFNDVETAEVQPLFDRLQALAALAGNVYSNVAAMIDAARAERREVTKQEIVDAFTAGIGA